MCANRAHRRKGNQWTNFANGCYGISQYQSRRSSYIGMITAKNFKRSQTVIYISDDATEEEITEIVQTQREQRETDMQVIFGLLHTNPWDGDNDR